MKKKTEARILNPTGAPRNVKIETDADLGRTTCAAIGGFFLGASLGTTFTRAVGKVLRSGRLDPIINLLARNGPPLFQPPAAARFDNYDPNNDPEFVKLRTRLRNRAVRGRRPRKGYRRSKGASK